MATPASLRHPRAPMLTVALVFLVVSTSAAHALPLGQEAPASPEVRRVGSVKSVQENILVLVTDKGLEMQVVVGATTRVLRAEPGQTDLKAAVPIEFPEIQPGDRVLVRGKSSGEGQPLAASLVVAIKKAAIEQKRSSEQDDWQKRGLGGLVKQVDPAARTLTITTSALTGRKPVTIHVSPRTVLRRYAPASVRFEDAKLGTFEEIRPGDQFRGRGNRSADGSEFDAEEIITGSFRSIAGTVSFADTDKKTLTVADLISKHPVLVRVTPETSLHVLPPMMADGIAMRLRGGPFGGPPNGPPTGAGGRAAPQAVSAPGDSPPPPGGPQGGWRERGKNTSSGPSGGPPGARGGPGQNPGGAPGNGHPDFQQLIARLPSAKLSDFPKGEAVMIVATAGNDPGEATAINLVGGVEPLLRASPEGSQEMMLSPWSLGGPAPEGGSQ